jgi:hypothetical protein
MFGACSIEQIELVFNSVRFGKRLIVDSFTESNFYDFFFEFWIRTVAIFKYFSCKFNIVIFITKKDYLHQISTRKIIRVRIQSKKI